VGEAKKDQPQKVMVYDLGGGTFDVTIMEIRGARYITLATDGDVQLGGYDWDQRLVDLVAEGFIRQHFCDPREDPASAGKLWRDCEDAKRTLSSRTKVSVPCDYRGYSSRIEVTREQFEESSQDLLDRTRFTMSQTLKAAGLQWSEVDRVLLTGGSTRMPMVRAMVRQISVKEPDTSVAADEAVAHGAALRAGLLLDKSRGKAPAFFIRNVNSHSLGVVGIHPKTRLRTNIVLIPRNTPLPARAVGTFTTAKKDQRSVRVPVVEGDSERPEDCIALGECVVRDLPPGLPQGAPIEVEYRYAANGRISVSARVPSVRHSAQVEIARDGSRSLDDLATWRARLLGREPTSSQPTPPPLPEDRPGDRAGAMKRLDGLYTRVGQAAQNLRVPPPLARSQQGAQNAAAELTRAQARLQEAQRARQAVAPGPETLRLDVALSQARDECQQAEVRCQFAFLVLGRECVQAGFFPPGTQSQAQEIREMLALLKS